MENEPSATVRNDQELPLAASADETSAPSIVMGENKESKEPNKENKAEPTPAELRQLLEEARAKADSYWNDLLRARAETENIRRRAERDVENAHKFAMERFITALLPVKDSLELGLAAVAEAAKLREGMDLTLKMLTSAMTKFGLAEVNPMNERFNPELHQAMTVQPSAAVPPHTVLTVYQKGYTLNERLIRPALVIVSQAPPDSGKT